jgi:hypothetical protein
MLAKGRSDLSPVGQLKIGMSERHQVMIAEGLSQFSSQLPVGPDQECGRHAFLSAFASST